MPAAAAAKAEAEAAIPAAAGGASRSRPPPTTDEIRRYKLYTWLAYVCCAPTAGTTVCCWANYVGRKPSPQQRTAGVVVSGAGGEAVDVVVVRRDPAANDDGHAHDEDGRGEHPGRHFAAMVAAQDGGFTAVVVPLPPLLCCCSCQNWLCNFNTNAYWCCPYFGRLKTYVSEIRDEAMVCVWKCEV